MVLLDMYRVCDYISLPCLVMFPEEDSVSYLDNISDKQNYGLLDSNLQ